MFGRKRKPEDFSDELRAHLALETDQLRAEGASEERARTAARRNMGNLTAAEERFYEASRWMWLDQLRQDVRFAFQQLRKSPGFTTVAVLTLALGIGANTAIFSLVNAVMLKSLPVADPQQLYRLGDRDACCVIGGFQRRFAIFSNSLYEYLRDHTPELEEMAACQAGQAPISVRRTGISAPPDPFVGEFVSGNYFRTMGIQALAGRTLRSEDDRRGAPPVAVISYRVWAERYANDPAVVGSTVIMDGAPVTISGVAPRGFFGETLQVDPPDFWLPLSTEPLLRGKSALIDHPDQHWLYIIGRLKAGVKPENLESKVNVQLQQWFQARGGSKLTAEQAKQTAQQHITVTPAGAGVAGMKDHYADGLKLLMITSGLVLLIACANIANLLLARGTASRMQASIRLALGAARGRLMRQTLTESVVLSLMGGALGVFVAWAGTRALLAVAFGGGRFVPIDPQPSLPVLGFAFLVSLITGMIFGAVPAWNAARFDPADALRGANRSTGNRSTLPQKSLVVLQSALSLALLAGAGLLTRSLSNLENQPYGFETDGRVMIRVNQAFNGYNPERLSQTYLRLQQRLLEIPGVRSASFSLYSPMRGTNWDSNILFEGRPMAATRDPQMYAAWDRVSAHYFETIGTRLVRGRVLDERDLPNSRRVTVINEAFARKYFANEDPMGKRFGMQTAADYEIVGVVEDAKYTEAREPAWPMFFLPYLQMAPADWADSAQTRSNYIQDIQLRVANGSKALDYQVRQALADVDANLTALRVQSFDEQVRGNFRRERLISRLTGLFGLLALVLACVGLYGITAYSVARRTSEIGIRTALGATRGNVIQMVLRGAMAQIGCGVALGIPLAIGGGKLLASQLYGIKNYDPVVLGGATLTLLGCAFIAGFVPARRATGIDPIQALRTE